MAVLTATELQKARNRAERRLSEIAYTKTQINAALQAIEDTLITRTLVVGDAGQTIQALVSSEVDTATSPFVFTNPQKKQLFAYWAERRFEADQ